MTEDSLICASDSDPLHMFRGNNKELAAALIKLTGDFRKYWPMTLRAFYYQAVAALIVENNQKQYRRVGDVLAKLRREGLVPWKAVEDKTRTTWDKRGVPNVAEYIEGQLDGFLDPHGYGRCYIQEQDVYVEVSVEKDAISTHVLNATWPYCTRVNVSRGQSSATLVNSMAERFDKAIMLGKEPILLHVGDLDPTGVQIPKSFQKAFSEHHYIEVDVRQIALTPEQCEQYDLPQSLDAAKADDPNIDRWYDEYGDQAPTEADALHPEQLKDVVSNALENVYDMTEVAEQKAEEAKERELLDEMRDEIIEHLSEAYPDEMQQAGYL